MRPAWILPVLTCLTLVAGEDAAALVARGQAQLRAGQGEQALETFLAASRLDSGTQALGWAARTCLQLSHRAGPDRILALRMQARDLIGQACRRNRDNPDVRTPLAELVGSSTSVDDRPPAPAAQADWTKAEALFMENRLAEACPYYEAAFAKDPGHAPSILYAGDCKLNQKDLIGALRCYRQAVAVDPRNSRARRFLLDGLEAAGLDQEIPLVCQEGLALDPGCTQLWDAWDLATRQGPNGRRLAYFRLEPRASLVPDGKGGHSLQVQAVEGPGGEAVTQAWTAYGQGLLGLPMPGTAGFQDTLAQIVAKAEAGGGKGASWGTADVPPLRRRLLAFKNLGQAVAGIKDQAGLDPALRQVAAWCAEGVDEAAVVLLDWDEAFRPELEAWTKAHPGALKAFLAKGVRPY